MQLILSREAREPMHLHWMNDCARHKETCASAVHHARTVRCGSVLPVSRRGAHASFGSQSDIRDVV